VENKHQSSNKITPFPISSKNTPKIYAEDQQELNRPFKQQQTFLGQN
jgi:hypothetical protein